MMGITEAYLKYKRQNRIIYVVLALIVIGLLVALFNGCHKSKQAIASAKESQAKADSLAAKMKEDSIQMASVRRFNQLQIDFLARNSYEKGLRIDSFEKELDKTQSTVGRLIKQIRYYKEGMPDDGLITVGVRYVQSCDSLADKAEEQNIQIDGLQFEVKGLGESMKKEIAIRDTTIKIERLYSDGLQTRVNFYSNLLNSVTKETKPRNKIYLTGTVLSDLTRYGIGGGFTLLTKKQKVWSAKVGIFNKQLFYQADFGALLSLRK